MRKRLAVAEEEPATALLRLVRLVVVRQPLGTLLVATEVTSAELFRTESLAAKPSARER